jgi:hypothetical protein
MLKSLRFAAVVSVVLLALTTACSSTKSSQNTSSASNSQSSTTASAQTSSSAATPEVALAIHLRQSGAKFYGAYWCPYCNKQKELFGKEAFNQIDYVECDPAGKNARPALCQQANIEGFPTWEIKGKKYGGLQPLQDLADISGYRGDRNFRN